MNIPKLLTITGPSGAGKSELLNLLCRDHGFERLISATTRPPRLGEVSGKDYYFISDEEFDQLRASGQLLQEASFNGASYGTTKQELSRITETGKVPAVIVEPSGVDQFALICKEAGYGLVSIFVGADLDQLVERFLNRMIGETITLENVGYFSRRLNSLFYEYDTWEGLHAYHVYVYNTNSLDSLSGHASNIADYINNNNK